VVVGAAREAPDTVGLGDPAGQHDHRQVRIDSRGETVGVAHAVDHLQAAAVLERKVEQSPALDTRATRKPSAARFSSRNTRVASSSSTTKMRRCSSTRV
jgi:hypothetical protein